MKSGVWVPRKPVEFAIAVLTQNPDVRFTPERLLALIELATTQKVERGELVRFLNTQALGLENSRARGPRLLRDFQQAGWKKGKGGEKVIAYTYACSKTHAELADHNFTRTRRRGGHWIKRGKVAQRQLAPIIGRQLQLTEGKEV